MYTYIYIHIYMFICICLFNLVTDSHRVWEPFWASIRHFPPPHILASITRLASVKHICLHHTHVPASPTILLEHTLSGDTRDGVSRLHPLLVGADIGCEWSAQGSGGALASREPKALGREHRACMKVQVDRDTNAHRKAMCIAYQCASQGYVYRIAMPISCLSQLLGGCTWCAIDMHRLGAL